MEDQVVRAALDLHWAASDSNDFDAEHKIYREDAVLEYPQSGERIRGRGGIQASRTAQPNKKRFTVRRILGAGDLWITEFILTYDGQPSYVVSIMEFEDDKVVRETQYFGDAFEPGSSRVQWVERKGTGPPPHSHDWDEAFYVLSGEIQFLCDGQAYACLPGTLVHIPRGTVHGFQYGKGGGRMLEITGENARAAQMFAAVDQAIPIGPPDIPTLLRVLEQNGVTVATPA